MGGVEGREEGECGDGLRQLWRGAKCATVTEEAGSLRQRVHRMRRRLVSGRDDGHLAQLTETMDKGRR